MRGVAIRPDVGDSLKCHQSFILSSVNLLCDSHERQSVVTDSNIGPQEAVDVTNGRPSIRINLCCTAVGAQTQPAPLTAQQKAQLAKIVAILNNQAVQNYPDALARCGSDSGELRTGRRKQPGLWTTKKLAATRASRSDSDCSWTLHTGRGKHNSVRLETRASQISGHAANRYRSSRQLRKCSTKYKTWRYFHGSRG